MLVKGYTRVCPCFFTSSNAASPKLSTNASTCSTSLVFTALQIPDDVRDDMKGSKQVLVAGVILVKLGDFVASGVVSVVQTVFREMKRPKSIAIFS